MKAEITEYDGCFSIDLIAETADEVADLFRFGANTTKELRGKLAYIRRRNDKHDASDNGPQRATASVVFGKLKKASNEVRSNA